MYPVSTIVSLLLYNKTGSTNVSNNAYEWLRDTVTGASNPVPLADINKSRKIGETFDIARQILWSQGNPAKKNLVLRNLPMQPLANETLTGDKFTFDPPFGFEFKPTVLSYEEIPRAGLELSSNSLPVAIHEVSHGLQPTEYNTIRAGRIILNPTMEAYADRTAIDLLNKNLKEYPDIRARVMPYIEDVLNVALNTYYSDFRPDIEFPEDVALFPLERNEDYLNSKGFRERFKNLTGAEFLDEGLTRNPVAYPQSKAYQKGLLESPIHTNLLEDIQSITNKSWDNSAAWYNNSELLKPENLAWFADDKIKAPVKIDPNSPYYQEFKQAHKPNRINYKFDPSKDMYNPNYSIFPLTGGYKPIPGFPEGINPRTPINNPYFPTETELSQLPNLYTTKTDIKPAVTSKTLSRAGNALIAADVLARGANDVVTLPDKAHLQYGMMSHAERNASQAYDRAFNKAKQQGKSDYEAGQLASNATSSEFNSSVMAGAVGNGINRLPQMLLDYTVKAPTDIYNLFQSAKEYAGFTPTRVKDIDTDKVTFFNLFGGDHVGSVNQGFNAIGQGTANAIQIPLNFAYNTFYQTPKDLITGLDPQWAKDQTQYYRPDVQENFVQKLEANAAKWTPEQQASVYKEWEDQAQKLKDTVKSLQQRINTLSRRTDSVSKNQVQRDTQRLKEKKIQLDNIWLAQGVLRKLNPDFEYLSQDKQKIWAQPYNQNDVYVPYGTEFNSEGVRDLLTPIE